MRLPVRVHLSCFFQTFIWLVLLYTIIFVFYLSGIFPLPDEELGIMYLLRFWAVVPIALMMSIISIPFIFVVSWLQNKYHFSHLIPVYFALPISLILFLISAKWFPIFIVPFLLVMLFIYPSSFQGSDWGGPIEILILSANSSISFMIYWKVIHKKIKKIRVTS